MGLKFGLYATTSVMALLAIAGCARWSEDAVAREARFNSDNLSLNVPVCDASWEGCDTPRIALLNAPTNVVYATRAGITPQAGSEEVDADGLEFPTQNEGDEPESVNNKE